MSDCPATSLVAVPPAPAAPPPPAALPDRPFDEKTASLAELKAVATTFAMSEMFKDCDTAAKCLAKMFVARDLGLSMTRGLLDIHMISGKPTLSANLIAGMIKKSGKYRYTIAQHTPEVCRLECFEKIDGQWLPMGPSEFTFEDAKTAGLLGNPTWKKFPKNMLFSRAISNAAKQYFGDVFLGSVYTPDELDTTIQYDAEGSIIPAGKAFSGPVQKSGGEDARVRAASLAADPVVDAEIVEVDDTVSTLQRDCLALAQQTGFPLVQFLKDNKVKAVTDLDLGGLRNLKKILTLRAGKE